MILCLIPPDNWWGQEANTFSGIGIPTSLIISKARSLASCLLMFSWVKTASIICFPTVITGFKDVIGSWKIIEISLPRISLISLGDFFNKSSPLYIISPAVILPGGDGINCINDKAVILLPQPDSPTTPKVSPGLILKLTSCTAGSAPRSVKKVIPRSLTSNNSLFWTLIL